MDLIHLSSDILYSYLGREDNMTKYSVHDLIIKKELSIEDIKFNRSSFRDYHGMIFNIDFKDDGLCEDNRLVNKYS